MHLTQIQYDEFPNTDREWRLEPVQLSQINLVVGKNATGKTRTLTLIRSLASLIVGDIPDVFESGSYKASFRENGQTSIYFLQYRNAQVTVEDLDINGSNVLHRGEGNLGRILAIDIAESDDQPAKQAKIRFQADATKVAVLSKRDATQHPFLEPLHQWARSVRHFSFGGELPGLAVLVKGVQVPINERETNHIVATYDRAIKKYKEDFKQSIIKQMESIGYPIQDLVIRRPANTIIRGLIPGELVGLAAKETHLSSATDQNFMSTGMLRALSLIIQTTYFCLEHKSGCFIIDDIGDGLDFERACQLIDLLRTAAKQSDIQLIMSTNNRFIMNRVPLDEWCVLERERNVVRALNYANARDKFERFKLTGLANFDLIATDFFHTAVPSQSRLLSNG